MARSGLCLLVLLVALAVYQLAAGEYYEYSDGGSGSGNLTNFSSNATNISGSLVPEGAVSTLFCNCAFFSPSLSVYMSQTLKSILQIVSRSQILAA